MGFGKYFRLLGLAQNLIMETIGKTADGDLTVPEMVDLIENGIRMIAPDLSGKDMQRFGALTTPAEFDQTRFEDGDVAFIFPREIIEKFKIEF